MQQSTPWWSTVINERQFIETCFRLNLFGYCLLIFGKEGIALWLSVVKFQLKLEAASFATFSFDSEVASQILCYSLRYVQSESMTTLVDLLRFLVTGLEVWLEQSFLIISTYPDSLVNHTYWCVHSRILLHDLSIGPHYDDLVAGRELNRVLNQVNQYLLNPQLIDHQIAIPTTVKLF